MVSVLPSVSVNGNGKVIAAPRTGTVVQYQDVPSNYIEARRVIG